MVCYLPGLVFRHNICAGSPVSLNNLKSKEITKMALRGNNWNYDEHLTLISIWAERSILSIFGSKQKNTGAYEAIQAKLEEAGYVRSLVQVQSKVKNLRQLYYKTKDAVNGGGASSETALKICPYYTEIDVFMGNKLLPVSHFLGRPTGKQTTYHIP